MSIPVDTPSIPYRFDSNSYYFSHLSPLASSFLTSQPGRLKNVDRVLCGQPATTPHVPQGQASEPAAGRLRPDRAAPPSHQYRPGGAHGKKKSPGQGRAWRDRPQTSSSTTGRPLIAPCNSRIGEGLMQVHSFVSSPSWPINDAMPEGMVDEACRIAVEDQLQHGGEAVIERRPIFPAGVPDAGAPDMVPGHSPGNRSRSLRFLSRATCLRKPSAINRSCPGICRSPASVLTSRFALSRMSKLAMPSSSRMSSHIDPATSCRSAPPSWSPNWIHPRHHPISADPAQLIGDDMREPLPGLLLRQQVPRHGIKHAITHGT